MLRLQARDGIIGDGHVQAEPDRIAIAQEVADRLLPAQRDVFSLIILEEQIETGASIIKVKTQFGFAQRGRQGLAGFQLQHLVGQVIRRPRVGGGQAQFGQSAADRLAVQHGQQGGLSHAAMAENADALRPAQTFGQRHGQGLRSLHDALVVV